MTTEDDSRPGAPRRSMLPHRTSGATPPAIILDRPQGRGPRSPAALRASTVAGATLVDVLLPDRLAVPRSDV